MAIPTPLSVGGTLEYLILFLIVANDTIAKKNPKPDPKIQNFGLSSFIEVMPKEYHYENPVTAYRKY